VVVPVGTSVVLTAGEAGGDFFQSWSGGGCSGAALSCTVVVNAATTVTATFSRANYAFVTSANSYTLASLTARGAALAPAATATAQFLAGADDACRALATAPGAVGATLANPRFVAFLSTSTASAASRVSGARGWMRSDGKPFADLFKLNPDLTVDPISSIYYPLELDEKGNDLGAGADVLTATDSFGRESRLGACADYTSTTGVTSCGERSAGAGQSFERAQCACAQSFRLYCFQVDHSTVMNFTPVAGRYAFVAGALLGGTGLAGFDAQCQSTAASSSLPGSYAAFVAPSTAASAASRFGGTTNWVRTDGVEITKSPADLLTGAKLLASFNVRADGRAASAGPWLGAVSPSANGSQDCVDWSSSASSLIGLMANAMLTSGYSAGPAAPCNQSNFILCLQK
jgi:hypothetical protein